MKKYKGFIMGFLTASLLAVPAVTFADDIQAFFNTVNVTLNGKAVASVGDSYTLDNGDKVPFSINYKGTTYLPIRKTAELIGMDIQYDNGTKTVNIGTKATTPPGNTTSPAVTTPTSPAVTPPTTTSPAVTDPVKPAEKTYSFGLINEATYMLNEQRVKVQQINATIDGKSVQLLTSKEMISPDFDKTAVYRIEKTNGVITDISEANFVSAVGSIKGNSIFALNGGKWGTVEETSSDTVKIDGVSYNIKGADIVKAGFDSSNDFDAWKNGNVAKDCMVVLLQTSKSSSSYDLVIVVGKSDVSNISSDFSFTD